MSCGTCGCATQPCGCCDGVQALTPLSPRNRPGLPALRYRAGTHGTFLQTMKGRLAAMEVDPTVPGGAQQPVLRPLLGLNTRDSGDPAIALLDAWAMVGDVLTFYQERNANEAYLRTATERRSVLELARLVGYKLRPGVAATTYLAYTLDDSQVQPVTIAAGNRSQSVPDPGETPQTFETSEDLVAQRDWNNLQVRLHRPQKITFDTALTLVSISVAGTSTRLKAGDKLLFLFDDGTDAVVRSVTDVDTQFADQRSLISLLAVDAPTLACLSLLRAFLAVHAQSAGSEGIVVENGLEIARQVYLGAPPPADQWISIMRSPGGAEGLSGQFTADLDALGAAIGEASGADDSSHSGGVSGPSKFVQGLLRPPELQARNSLNLTRNLAQAFLAQGGAKGSDDAEATASATGKDTADAHVLADVSTQLLVNFVPYLEQRYYAAWSGATVNGTAPALKAVHALRARAALFGATAAKLPKYTLGDTDPDPEFRPLPRGLLKPQSKWDDWTYDPSETDDNAFLDQANDAIVQGSFVLADVSVQTQPPPPQPQRQLLPNQRQLLQVASAASTQRTAYGLSGPSTRLVLRKLGGGHWRSTMDAAGKELAIDDLRQTQLLVQSEPLTLVDETLTAVVGTDKTVPANEGQPENVELDALYKGLVSGRWVIFSGERADIPNVDGVQAAELQMIAGLRQGFDPTLPGDQTHTTLLLAKPLAYRYKRSTLKIFGNVVKATHGQTRVEPLGGGDGAQTLQSFTLKQPPLTFVAAPNPDGVQSTLQVRVNDVLWHETESLAWQGPKDHSFETSTDDAGNTTLTFGDGVHGARLPTGAMNVGAVYRNGIGAVGNVNAGQVTLLQTRPLGVKSVLNPLRASGGADKETRDLARENAPLSVMPLDRLVSVQDYADFTRRFAGIAKSVAIRTSDGGRQLVYITIAGTDDVPIDTTSDLYVNLLDALRRFGDPDLALRVDARELLALVLSANIKLAADYEWDAVAVAVRQVLQDGFGFDRRALGQPALLCEVLAAIQGVRGVAYVDVDAFGAVPQSVAIPGDADGARSLLTPDQIAAAVARIATPRLWVGPKGRVIERLPPDVPAWGGGFRKGTLQPAQLAVFVPAVTDTLVLNQIP